MIMNDLEWQIVSYYVIYYVQKSHAMKREAYEICLKRTNYPISIMQDFRYLLYTSLLDCCDQVVSPLWATPAGIDRTYYIYCSWYVCISLPEYINWDWLWFKASFSFHNITPKTVKCLPYTNLSLYITVTMIYYIRQE